MLRLISKGDVIVTRSSRVVKNEDEYSRPDKGERVKVTMAIRVEETKLDSSIERLKVRGEIVETDDESIGKAGSHSVSLSAGRALTIRKEKWTNVEINLVKSANSSSHRVLLVAIDRREAGIGTLSGSHLAVLTSVESGLGGKMTAEQNPKPYFSKVADIIVRDAKEQDMIVVAGPGQSKGTLGNALSQALGGKPPVRLIDGFDLAGADGVRGMVKYPAFQELAKDSTLVEMQRVVEEVVRRLAVGDTRVCYSYPRVRDAATAGAVEACAVSDDVFANNVREDQLVSTLNAVEERGGRVYLADSSLEFGKQVSSFGGIVALLRYPVKA